MYLNNVSFTRQRDSRVHAFQTGTRDNVRGVTLGPTQAGGSVSLPVSADELVEFCLMTVAGGVTPTTPVGSTAARLWTFKPSNTLDSTTFERIDGANIQRLLGSRGNQLRIQGSVAGDNTATVDLFATDRQTWAGPLTTLTERVPTFLEGWQTYLWIDTFGSAPGSTLIPNALISWDITFNGNLGRKYTAGNTLAATSVTLGNLDISANLQLEASAAQTITELTNWDANTSRTVRLEFVGPVNEIEAGANEAQTITVTGTPTGGTFTVNTFLGTTGTIAFNSTSGAAQTVFDTLMGTGNTVVTGGPLPGTALTVTFAGAYAGRDLPQFTLGTNSLTGGTTPTATFATTTPGRTGARAVTIDLPGVWETPDLNQTDAGTRTYSFPLSYVYEPTNLAAGIQIRLLNNRATAY